MYDENVWVQGEEHLENIVTLIISIRLVAFLPYCNVLRRWGEKVG